MLYKQELGSPEHGTIVVDETIANSGTIGPVTIDDNVSSMSVGINTDTAVAVNHELWIGGQWVQDGSSTISTDGNVSSFTHHFKKYRAVRKDPAGNAVITATFESRS